MYRVKTENTYGYYVKKINVHHMCYGNSVKMHQVCKYKKNMKYKKLLDRIKLRKKIEIYMK